MDTCEDPLGGSQKYVKDQFLIGRVGKVEAQISILWQTPTWIYFSFFFFFSVYLLLRDRERQSMSMGGAERGGDTESEAGSRL